MKNLIAKVKASLVTRETKSLNTKRFINHDGTIAENHLTYKEFKQDIINSYGRC